MEDCAKINIIDEFGVKMSKKDKKEKINFITFKSLVMSLKYLSCTLPYIIFGEELISKFMKTPAATHFKTLN